MKALEDFMKEGRFNPLLTSPYHFGKVDEQPQLEDYEMDDFMNVATKSGREKVTEKWWNDYQLWHARNVESEIEWKRFKDEEPKKGQIIIIKDAYGKPGYNVSVYYNSYRGRNLNSAVKYLKQNGGFWTDAQSYDTRKAFFDYHQKKYEGWEVEHSLDEKNSFRKNRYLIVFFKYDEGDVLMIMDGGTVRYYGAILETTTLEGLFKVNGIPL